jgi:hypothetical protein
MTRWRQPSVSPCIIASRNSPQRPIIAKTESKRCTGPTQVGKCIRRWSEPSRRLFGNL